MNETRPALAPLRFKVVAIWMIVQAWLVIVSGFVLVVAALLDGLASSVGFLLLVLGLLLAGIGWLFYRLAVQLRSLSNGARWTFAALSAIGLILDAVEIFGTKGSSSANLLALIPNLLVNIAVLYVLAFDGKTRAAFNYEPGTTSRTVSTRTSDSSTGLGSTLLKVENLTVSFPTSDGLVQAVRGLSFDVAAGRTLGVVGESGSGKSVSALTMLGLNPGADISGSAVFDGRELLSMTPAELRHLRGNDIAMIFQDPLSSLHPHYRIGWQIVETIQAHTEVSKKEARERAIELLHQVNIPQPDRRIDAYPHEMSGGMRQRVMIAMALALKPKLLIADEPTTAVDATVQAQLMELLVSIQKDSGMAMIMITHDLGVIATIADDVLVMYAGRASERATTREIFFQPHHPYTRGLLRSIPSATGVSGRLEPIVGQPPSLINPPHGCAFHPRCPFAMSRCMQEQPPLSPVSGPMGHTSACWLPPDAVGITPEADAMRIEYASTRRDAHSEKLPGVAAGVAHV